MGGMCLVSAIYEQEILFGEGFVVMEHAHGNTGVYLNLLYSVYWYIHGFSSFCLSDKVVHNRRIFSSQKSCIWYVTSVSYGPYWLRTLKSFKKPKLPEIISNARLGQSFLWHFVYECLQFIC